MPVKDKKSIFELPLKFVLTEEGSSVFMRQNRRLVRLKMGDNSEEYGLSLDKTGAASLQRMMLVNYISKLEISGVDPVACRGEIIDFSKLLVYGLIYRQFSIVSFSQLLASEPIKKWNRANPFNIIDGKTQFKEGFLRSFLQEYAQEVAALRQELLQPLHVSITKDSKYLAEEKNIQIFLSEKFVEMMNPAVWFLLHRFRDTKDAASLLSETRTCLIEYMEKTKIAEYVALMLIELAVNVENLNILREAKSLYKNTNVDINSIVMDPKLRAPIIEELRRKNSLVTFSWKFGGTSSSIGTRGRFQITMYDKETNYKEIRESIDATKSADVNRKNLSDFYRDLSKSGADSELGMYYLSYLNEACEQVGIRFESMVNQVQNTDVTVTTLSFYL
jgi:hypothetical protein